MLLEKTLNRLTTGEKIVWSSTSILTWWHSLHFFALSWGPILSILSSVVVGISVSTGSVVAIDYYKENWKHKLFKRKKDGREKDHEKAA